MNNRCLSASFRSIFLALSLVAPVAAQDFEIYISDAGMLSNPPWQILKFDANGENPELFTNQNLAWPQDIVFLEDQGVALISNLNSNQINRHDAETGAFIDVFATSASGPTRMKIGPDGLLYVLQWSGDGRVRRYQLDGTPAADFTTTGLSQSIGLDWDSNNNLLVSSFDDALVQRFDDQGADQGALISSNLQGPTNLWFEASGDLLVLDWSGGAIRRFSAGGNFLGNFATGLTQPEGIAQLPGGDLLIGNGGTSSVRRYTSTGTLVGDFIASGTSGLIQPNAVVIRPLGDPFAINAGLNDAWFNAGTAGQGFLISVFPDLQQMFVAWFTFDSETQPGNTATLGGPQQRWFTAQGGYDGNQANLTVFSTTGGVFDSPSPAPVTDGDGEGTLTVTFSDCAAGTMSYNLTRLGLTGVIPIQRVTNDNVALCESLAAAARR
ncbi:MAG: hypothetical protein AAGA23_06315 [Pseudomonadota bacterium]